MDCETANYIYPETELSLFFLASPILDRLGRVIKDGEEYAIHHNKLLTQKRVRVNESLFLPRKGSYVGLRAASERGYR